jgi:CheY-like chemotaxis protein
MIPIPNLIKKNIAEYRILVADDHSEVRRAVRKELREIGFTEFREAADGDEALKKLRAEPIDFLICDWEMPQMSGLVVLLHIRNDPELSQIPVLMIVDRNDAERLDDLIGGDEDGFLVKPVKASEFQMKMSEILFKKMPPSPLDSFLRSAGRMIADRNYTLAHQELSKAESISPRDPLVNYFRRLVYKAEGREDEAEKATAMARRVFKQLIKGPRRSQLKTLQGRALLADNKLEAAELAFKQALEMDPGNPERRVSIGETYLAYGHMDKAEQYFLAYIDSCPDNVYIYNRLGMAYRRQHKFDRAIEHYKRALEIDPNEEYVMYNLGRAYVRAARLDLAVDMLKNALEIRPDFREARDLLDVLEEK